MKITQAKINDALAILNLQKLAYQSEAERYHDFKIPPLTQTLSEVKEQFKTNIFLKAVKKEQTVGTVRAYKKDKTCHIGRLAVHPLFQKQGIGTALMQAIEAYFPQKRFELFVGAKSDNNINLYQKLGYKIYKKGKHEGTDIDIFYMEKLTGK